MKFAVLLALCCFVAGLNGESLMLAEKDKFVQKQKQTNIHHIYNKCDASDCKGVRGPKGERGLRGLPGKSAASNPLKNQIKKLQSELAEAKSMLYNIPKSVYCYMGVRNNDIPDHSITASSFHGSAGCKPYFGRLDNNQLGNSWCARANVRDREWLQIDLGGPKSVAGIVTQGRGAHSQWVTSFKIACGTTTANMRFVTKHGSEIFRGNWDMFAKVNSMFEKPLTCRYVRVYPMTYNGHMSMRVEVIRGSCSGLYH